jgi:hypothetical protein
MNGLPGGLPGRVDSESTNHLAGGTVRRPSRDDSYASTDQSVHTPSRLGPIALDRLRRSLTPRESAILSSVAQHRYLTGQQLEQLHFQDHVSAATANRIRCRVLARLTKTQMLIRLDRRIGGVRAGSVGFVYRLGTVGHRLVYGDATQSGRTREPSSTFLDHTLAVAQLAIDTLLVAKEAESNIEIVALECEPDCWRSFQKGLGGREALKPDLFMALGVGDYEDRWFIEIDRGTESTVALIKKCQLYLDYQRTGIEQHKTDVFPKVLWIAITERRAVQIEKAISSSRDLRGSDIFVVTTNELAVGLLAGGLS